MKNKILGVVICITLLLQSTVYATNTTAPGSSNDPVVSKSYVDTLVGGILESLLDLQNSYNELSNEVESIKTTVINIQNSIKNGNVTENTTGTSVAVNYAYAPLELQKNQLLLGGEGTEIIVRSGGAVGYTEVANGLSNVSAGTEIMNGQAVPLNNVLVVSRADNRGIFVTEQSTWILIRGDYTIINP